MSISNSDPRHIKSQDNQTIFFWIDILGFSEQLEKPEGYEILKENLQYFRNLFNKSELFKPMIISDGLLLQLIKREEINDAVKALAEKQKQFILDKKMFLRGGIAAGIIPNTEDIEKNLILTDGLSRAVKLESKNVSWPVIATNENNLKIMRDLLKTSDDKFGLIEGFNERGEKIYFVNFIEEMHYNESEKQAYFQLLNDKIKEFSKKEEKPDVPDKPDKSDKSNIKNKYIWLLRYFYHRYGQTEYKAICKELERVVL